MPRSTRCLMALCPILLATACAQSIHQTERLTRGDYAVDSGFAGDQSYSYWPWTGYGAGYGIGYGAGYLGESARVLRVSVRPVWSWLVSRVWRLWRNAPSVRFPWTTSLATVSCAAAI